MRLGLFEFEELPPVTKGLLIACLSAYALSLIATQSAVNPIFGLVPLRLTREFWVWQPFTYIFLHGGFFHLIFNMFMLWMFGRVIEASLGTRNFLKYFFVCGAGAGLFNALITPHSVVPVIGASGAIFGLIAAFALLYPETVVRVYFIFPMKARTFALVVAALEFFATFESNRGIANLAHLGGMLTGYAYLRWWPLVSLKVKGAVRSTGLLDSGRQAPGVHNVDAILDKISTGGVRSLTREEREFMRDYSERMKK